MNPGELTITVGALTILLVEAIKFVIRRWIVKDMAYELPTAFYAIFIPVSNALMPFVVVALGLPSTDPVLSMGLVGIIQYLLRIIISSLVTLVGYNGGLKPLKDYSKARQLEGKN